MARERGRHDAGSLNGCVAKSGAGGRTPGATMSRPAVSEQHAAYSEHQRPFSTGQYSRGPCFPSAVSDPKETFILGRRHVCFCKD